MPYCRIFDKQLNYYPHKEWLLALSLCKPCSRASRLEIAALCGRGLAKAYCRCRILAPKSTASRRASLPATITEVAVCRITALGRTRRGSQAGTRGPGQRRVTRPIPIR